MKNFSESKIVTELMRLTRDMYHAGWHERNAGNISVIIPEADIAGFSDVIGADAKGAGGKPLRTLPLTVNAKSLAGKLFLVTGTGKFFKNVEADPELNLGLVRIAPDGKSAQVLWGFSDGGKFTSEFSTHLLCHEARLKVNPNHRVVMHGHPTNLVAMSYVHPLAEREFTRTLWQMCIEAILVFPEGFGTLPWMLCGTDEIGVATAKKMEEFRIALWAMHGVFGSGSTPDEAFGLIETAEKSAEIYMKTAGMKKLATTSDEQILALADFWKAPCRREWLGGSK